MAVLSPGSTLQKDSDVGLGGGSISPQPPHDPATDTEELPANFQGWKTWRDMKIMNLLTGSGGNANFAMMMTFGSNQKLKHASIFSSLQGAEPMIRGLTQPTLALYVKRS